MADKKKTILIVDDDSRNIFALRMVLRTKGFDCLSAPGGPEALSLLARNPDIGIILMDMMMPEMDGYQTIAELRKMEGAKNIPVIAVTAQAMKGDREKCLDAGAADYISKPVDVDALMAVLTKFM